MTKTDKLVLIMGSPRSSTTAFHNALIQAGAFKGIIGTDTLDRDPAVDAGLYTDEYYPSMRAPLDAEFAKDADEERHALHDLTLHLSRLEGAFGSVKGMMLKAPHYVFGIRAYRQLFPKRLRIMFTHRDPFAIAKSMTLHPHIQQQLPLSIDQCTDFMHVDILGRYGLAEAVSFARGSWPGLTLFERGLFVWHLFANAFLTAQGLPNDDALVVRNESFDKHVARQIGDFLSLSQEQKRGFSGSYRALPLVPRNMTSLSHAGEKLWSLIEPLDVALNRRSMR